MDPETDVQELGASEAQGPAAGSVAAKLVAKRHEIASARAAFKLLDVPDYDGQLFVRYRWPEAGYQPVIKAIERAQESKDSDASLWGNVDLLALCCESVLARDESGSAVMLATGLPVDPSEPVEGGLRFGKSLASLLQIEVPEEVKSPARYVLRAVFSPKAVSTGVYEGDLAIMAQGGKLLRWLQREEREISEEFSEN